MLSFKPALVMIVLGLLLPPLSACGFQPLYTNNGVNTAASFNDIGINSIPDQSGVTLRNHLLDMLYTTGEPHSPKYTLAITQLKKSVSSFGIKKSATSTRGQIDMSAQMTLTDNTTGAAVLKRTIRAAADFNRLDNEYATQVSEESVTENLLAEMSGNIKTELALHFSRTATPAP
jgi:hypothetical protein